MIAGLHRPTQIRVQLQQIKKNAQVVAASLPAGTQVFAVVKANAYGHGAVAVAKELATQVDGFCVSNFDEALELRQAGLEHPILVLGLVPVTHVPLAIQMSVSLTVSHLDWFAEAKKQGIDLANLALHLKVDTGMGRLGFGDLPSLLSAIEEIKEVGARFEGLFTHFATADQADDSYFQRQLARFKGLLADLPTLPRLIHASNSAAALWHREAHFNMVRLGDVLYGLNPSGRELPLLDGIEPALELTSELVQVKSYFKGESIGYGATYQSLEDEYIGTVPIGYADGLLRSMQGFSVLVEGKPCPIVGRVSMDQVTIRLPHLYPVGTTVTLLGQDGGETITAQDWADYQGTINYEVVCLLSDRLPRYYD